MPPPHPQPADLRFPVLGIDRSLPANLQAPGTTWDMLNCRGFPPSSDQLGGGSREGYSKLFEDAAGTDGARRITGLDVLTESSAITNPDAYTTQEVVEDWSGYTQETGSYLGHIWTPTRFTAGTATIPNNYQINSSGQLAFNGPGNGSARAVLSSYFIDQAAGVSVTIYAHPQAVTTDQGWGQTSHPDNVGPILFNSTVTEAVFAYIVPTASNQVQCRIYTWNLSGGFSQAAASSTITLTGDTTDTDWVITINNVGGFITATFKATGVVSGGGDLDVELTTTTSIDLRRGGIGTRGPNGIPGSPSAFRRFCTAASLTALIPPTTPSFHTLSPTAPNPYDSNQYYVPPQWTAFSRSDAGVLTEYPAGTTSSSAPPWVGVDDTGGTVTGALPGTTNADYGQEFQYAIWQGDDSVRPGLEWFIYPNEATNVWQNCLSPIFRASKDGRYGLVLLFSKISDRNPAGYFGYRAGSDFVRGFAIIDNVVTDLGSIAAPGNSTDNPFVCNRDLPMRITDDGTTIRMYHAGILLVSFTPSTFPNWTTDIGESLAPYSGVGMTCGVNTNNTALNRGNWGEVRIVQGETGEAPSYSNIKNRMAVYAPETIHVGDTINMSISPVAGVMLRQPRPESASFNRKFYAVDGERSVIVDPLTLTSLDWASQVSDGALPSGCQLIAAFRGAPYLAATDSDPTIWYKGRTLDWLDWDYGADPQVSTAVAGNNGEVGQPADAITALVPFSDDYLVFGMARSLGVLEGDPNYGGQFQIASREAGIVGPRAVCFDDRGNMWFMGAGGLYRMLRGAFDPEPVGPRKLRRALEELDTSVNLIQMQFRASDRTVRIYVTPTDGGAAATCFVYDTRTEAFYADQLPLHFGPWAIEQITGVEDIDRNLIIGGNDGYIRRPDDEALTDDGDAIPSYVEIPVPDMGSGGLLEYIAQELQFVLAEGGGTITWRWFTGRSPEEVRQMQPGQEVARGTISGRGFQEPIGLRATGAAHKLRLDATGTEPDGVTASRWALERITALLAPTSRRR